MTKYLTHLQLKAARHALNFGVRDIAKVLRVSKATISKAELDKTRDFFYKHGAALTSFFESNNIFFPNEYCIRYGSNTNIVEDTENILTRFQLKVARNIIGMTQYELAQIIHVNKRVITEAEKLANDNQINKQYNSIVLQLKHTFQIHDIIFPDQSSIFYKKYVDKRYKEMIRLTN